MEYVCSTTIDLGTAFMPLAKMSKIAKAKDAAAHTTDRSKGGTECRIFQTELDEQVIRRFSLSLRRTWRVHPWDHHSDVVFEIRLREGVYGLRAVASWRLP